MSLSDHGVQSLYQHLLDIQRMRNKPLFLYITKISELICNCLSNVTASEKVIKENNKNKQNKTRPAHFDLYIWVVAHHR